MTSEYSTSVSLGSGAVRKVPQRVEVLERPPKLQWVGGLMNSGRFVAGLLAVAMASGCRTTGDTQRTLRASATANGVEASLDSCEAVKWPSRDTTPPLRPHARLAGRVRSYGRFSFWVPDSAHVTIDSTRGGVGLTWPDCEKCRFGVSVQRDTTTGGLEGRIAKMIASQKVIDSINNDPHTTIHEFDEIDGPPRPFTTAAGRGYLIDESCGDCAATTILFGRRGWIAEIGFGSDDDTPEGGRHECEMLAVAKSFAWRE